MSLTCCMKYSAGKPAIIAFSGRPRPSARWQKPHAITAGFRPCSTNAGGFGCVSGFQSATSYRSRVRPTENVTRLVGSRAGAAVSVPVADGALPEPSEGNAHAGMANACALVSCADCACAATDAKESAASAATERAAARSIGRWDGARLMSFEFGGRRSGAPIAPRVAESIAPARAFRYATGTPWPHTRYQVPATRYPLLAVDKHRSRPLPLS